MNAPETFLTAQLGDAEIRVPREAAVMAYLEQEIDRRRPITTVLTARTAERLQNAIDPPAIGAEWQGGVYAGLTLHENAVHRLVLLPGEVEAADHDTATSWARNQGGTLPTRIDQLMLWQNLRAQFQAAYYWSCEQSASVAESAWTQGFGFGDQGDWPKSGKTRARAVRRIPI
jgi:hypothetical protein